MTYIIGLGLGLRLGFEVTKIHEVKLQLYKHARGIRWNSSNTDGDSLKM